MILRKIKGIGGESMQDVILLVSTSAIFIFGDFLMKKLDVFLENNFEPITQRIQTYQKNAL